MGLGCGGPSRVGLSTGRSTDESVKLIRKAVDSGVTFLDTAEAYETETLVGQALRGGLRERVVLSTKKTVTQGLDEAGLRRGLEESLRRLGTDRVEIYHLHGVKPEDYPACVERHVPVLQKLREEGKIRFTGITEHFGTDTRHGMLERALRDDTWDVVMVGLNLLNQSARRVVLPLARQRNVGVLVMFALRRVLSLPERLREAIRELVRRGEVDASVDTEDTLGFLVHDGGAVSVADAAYRFCRYEPGVHVVLAGTGNPVHLEENMGSLSRPALPAVDVARLADLFHRVDSISGN
jgi:aryl-alcohol dehydrogenase-like predicted oxidoreductase